MNEYEINKACAILLGWVRDSTLDIIVAGRVIDQTWRRGMEIRRGGDWLFKHQFRYCTDITAAWELTHFWKGKLFSIVRKPDGWCASFGDGENLLVALLAQAEAATGPMAICLAFIKLQKTVVE